MTRNTKGRIPVTRSMRRTLKNWQAKTGFGIMALFKYAKLHNLIEPRKSLTGPAFHMIVHGSTQTVKEEDYKTVLRLYRSLPKEAYGKAKQLNRNKIRQPLCEDFRLRLQKTIDARAIGREALLRLHGAPPGLSAGTLGRILSGKIETVSVAHAEFLEALMASYNTETRRN